MKSQEILKKNYEFNRVYRKGKRRHGREMSLYYMPRRVPGVRVGFTVSRKVRGAVQRNRVKRVLREIWRSHRDEVKDGCWVILMGRTEALPGTYEELDACFVKLMSGAGLFKDD